MHTACAPARTNERMRACSDTASGVVLACASRRPGKPLPSVPITAHLRRARVSACAIHWLQDVLPLVPVMPMVHNRALGLP